MTKMTEQPLVSIIVPVYNVEMYLVECLESLRCQTYRNIEIICVNDGSQDRSQLLLDLFDELDNRIVVIKQENKGLPGARNTGLEAAKGDIIMFVDSDDALEPTACKTVVEAFCENDPADMVVFGASLIGQSWEEDPWLIDTLDVRDVVYDEFCLDVLFEENAQPFVWRNAFSKEFLDANNLRFEEDIKFGEDKVFQFSAFPKTKRSVFISDQIYRYRVSRAGSLMNSTGATNASSAAKNKARTKEREKANAIKIANANATKIAKHVSIVDRICERWTESGDIEKYMPELFKWTLDFMGYDTLKLNPLDQENICNQMAALWAKWFPEDVFSRSNLSKYYQQRYEWMSGSYTLEQREAIRAQNDKNARAIDFDKLGRTGTLKRVMKAPLRKVYRGFKHVLPTPASSNFEYLGYVYNKMNKMAEEGGNSSVQTLLLILEMKAQEQSKEEGRLEQ